MRRRGRQREVTRQDAFAIAHEIGNPGKQQHPRFTEPRTDQHILEAMPSGGTLTLAGATARHGRKTVKRDVNATAVELEKELIVAVTEQAPPGGNRPSATRAGSWERYAAEYVSQVAGGARSLTSLPIASKASMSASAAVCVRSSTLQIARTACTPRRSRGGRRSTPSMRQAGGANRRVQRRAHISRPHAPRRSARACSTTRDALVSTTSAAYR